MNIHNPINNACFRAIPNDKRSAEKEGNETVCTKDYWDLQPLIVISNCISVLTESQKLCKML
jgi:hypothetical protein